jgi:hypothetical protein
MTISWKFRRSCAGRPTDRRGLRHQDDPGQVPGSLQSGRSGVCRRVVLRPLSN